MYFDRMTYVLSNVQGSVIKLPGIFLLDVEYNDELRGLGRTTTTAI